MYEKIINTDLNGDVRIIDLRSDTISKPTQEMREAMYSAVVGDDVFGEDPTVNELERRAAELLGKEDAVFVASGTMANLIAIMVHCNQRGCEIISGDNGHTFRFEQGGPSQIAGVQSSLLRNNPDGTFSLDELREKIRKNPDCHEPITSLIIVENTHNMCGGKVLPLEWLEKVSNIAAEHKIPVHMDGARVMNAAVYLRVTPKRIVRDVDSVCFCLSKGLGCPVGALLAGSKSFVAKARRTRKVLGGGWRQAGFLAAAGLVALDKMIDRLHIDHEHAYKLAKAIADCNSLNFRLNLDEVQTNIFLVFFNSKNLTATDFVLRVAEVREDDPCKISIRICSRNNDSVRFVTWWGISDEDIDLAIKKIVYVIREFDNKIKNKL